MKAEEKWRTCMIKGTPEIRTIFWLRRNHFYVLSLGGIMTLNEHEML
jgi:hypothetical protein